MEQPQRSHRGGDGPQAKEQMPLGTWYLQLIILSAASKELHFHDKRNSGKLKPWAEGQGSAVLIRLEALDLTHAFDP